MLTGDERRLSFFYIIFIILYYQRTLIGSQPAALLQPIKRLTEQTLTPGYFYYTDQDLVLDLGTVDN